MYSPRSKGKVFQAKAEVVEATPERLEALQRFRADLKRRMLLGGAEQPGWDRTTRTSGHTHVNDVINAILTQFAAWHHTP